VVDIRRTLTLIRGLPGSGKSTIAKRLNAAHVEADMYFVGSDGEYHFDPIKLRDAHAWAQERVRQLMACFVDVVVSNTFSQMWELKPYLKLAQQYGYKVMVVTIETDLSDEELAARNIHGCPAEKIKIMRERWEPYRDVGEEK
jgi:predicted kinase